MPHKNCQLTEDDDDDENAVCENVFWSKYPDEITFDHLQKFWSELSPQARKDLLKVDKQSVFEQARKNMYCSRCIGLLLECFMQILMDGKSLELDEASEILYGKRRRGKKNHNDGVSNLASGCNDGSDDPATHPWGGLTPAKDGSLTVLSSYIDSKSLNGLQDVFDSAREREKERELLYPDACGGGGRGWISHGTQGYGRVHVARETCALHTDRISCDTLVDFWSALAKETHQGLLRMEEEDFVGKLMYRFDSKRFCRDCRKNVIREFKELKELKRTKRKPRCTRTYCAADSIFQYEVSDDSIQADWRRTFTDSSGTYHHFEWAVGSGEGKSDILEFENVGMKKRVNVDGLDLRGLSACYITLRAWKQDGKCNELSVKAHALKGRDCVHHRFLFEDGFVSITEGESIRKFFEHAEEAEEDEDYDVMDKDGHELDADCSHPQKHAKSPELAREFLLDAATVIFKEQAEKAFREGNARLNAHSVFVCLVVKLLEERVQVACKEIITLEMQAKLVEEEEKEKREKERKERRRMKAREKKQKRKDKLKGKERDNDKDADSLSSVSFGHQVMKDEHSSIADEECVTANSRESLTKVPIGSSSSSNVQDPEISSDWYSRAESRDHCHNVVADPGDYGSTQDEYYNTTSEHSEYSFQGDNIRKDDSVPKWSRSDKHGSAPVTRSVHPVKKSESRIRSNNYEAYSRSVEGLSRQVRANGARAQSRNCPIKHGNEKFHLPCSRIGERYIDSCSCNYVADNELIGGSKVPTGRTGLEEIEELKADSTSGKVKQFYNGSKSYCVHDSRGRFHGNNKSENHRGQDLCHTKMTREPMDPQEKYPRRNAESDIVMLSSSLKEDVTEASVVPSLSTNNCFGENGGAYTSKNPCVKDLSVCDLNKGKGNDNLNSNLKNFDPSVDLQDNEVDLSLKASTLNDCSDAAVGSDSCSKNSFSNLCDMDRNLTPSNAQSLDTRTSSDSKDSSLQSGNKETPPCLGGNFPGTPVLKSERTFKSDILSNIPFEIGQFDHQVNPPANSNLTSVHVSSPFLSSESHVGLPPAPNQSIALPMFHQARSSVGYYHPSTVIWPTASANSLMAMPQLSPYVVSSPINYGWDGNSGLSMPYGGMTHVEVEPPLLSQGQLPIYSPVSEISGMHPEKQIKISKPVVTQEVTFQGHNKVQGLTPCILPEATPKWKTVHKPDQEKAHIAKENNDGFSLFYYGGPVALSSTLKEGKINELALNNSVVQAEVDHVCSNNVTTMEEYSLFASSNGFQFSL